jgi:hypothetical protein
MGRRARRLKGGQQSCKTIGWPFLSHFQVLMNGEFLMPTMSDDKRRRIVSKQRKLENAKKRAAKIAKKARNAG